MKTNRWPTRLFLVLVAAAVAQASSLCYTRADEPTQSKSPSLDKKAEPAKKSDKNKVTAIVGGDVYTVTHEVIRGGTVLIKDGKIIRVGQDVAVPEGATVIDAKGKYVTPGYVALSMSGVGVRGGATGGGGRRPGGGQRGGPAAGGKLVDSLDPFDRNMKFSLGVGITTGCIELGGGAQGRFGRNEDEDDADDPLQTCPCCGLAILPTEPITPQAPTTPTPRQHAVLKMSYGHLDSMLVKESPFYHLPGTGLAGALNRFTWRDNLRQARKYIDDLADYELAIKAGEQAFPPRAPSEELVRLVKKEIALRTDASSVTQIRDMIKLAKELGYKLVLENAHEAWMCADELAEGRAAVVLTPRSRRRATPGHEDDSGSSIETSAYLEKAGVPFAIATQMNSVSMDGVNGGRDLTGIALEAAFAVRGGCSEKTALAALTLVPARILGLEERIGSIDEGKDADLLILNGPPLDYRTYVQTAIVGGKVCYERNQDRIYPTFERAGP
jgi:imidazolonepropionase-like amidohydrolase